MPPVFRDTPAAKRLRKLNEALEQLRQAQEAMNAATANVINAAVAVGDQAAEIIRADARAQASKSS